MNDDNKQFVGTEIYTFRESEMWVACWRRFNVFSQGKDENAAITNLLRTIGHLAIRSAEEDRLPSFGTVKAVDEKLLARWQRLFEEWHD